MCTLFVDVTVYNFHKHNKHIVIGFTKDCMYRTQSNSSQTVFSENKHFGIYFHQTLDASNAGVKL